MLPPLNEQRRLEEALRESEARFRALFDQANDAIFMLLDGAFIDCNAKGQEMYGRTRAQILGHKPDDFSPSIQPDGRDSKEKGRAIFYRVLTGEAQFFEWLSCLPDGTPLYTEVSLNRLKLAGKNYVQAIMRDITERKRAEENNVRSLALLRATLDSTADGILTIGLDRQILSFNETFTKMWRIPADVLATKNDDLAIQCVLDQLAMPELFLAKVRHLYDHPLQESFDVLDFKDGRVFERFSRPMLADGRPIGRVWSFRDATERKRAVAQIAEQAACLDKARDAIVVREFGGKVLIWNYGAERVYGWSRREIVGRNVLEVLHTDPKIFEELTELTINQGEWIGELQHLTKDGREILVEVRCTLIRDDEGRPKSIFSINTDITEKKKAEAQIMRAQRMESIGTLAGGIAHDLNNILAPIMMSITILKAASNNGQTMKILESIEASAKRGAEIVRQVLSYARGVEGARIEVHPEHLLKDLENIIKETFPKDIRWQFSIPGDTRAILGDPTQLQQILLNLCVNARDAMPDGGNLTIGVENCVLEAQDTAISLQAKAGRYVAITVTDTGTGIPPALLDKIFEPFFTTKGLNKGTGLGLSTVIAIVKSHGGFVNVTSEPGKGTTFKVYLPTMEVSPEEQRAAVELASLPRGNGETILVVDDEASILAITGQTLEVFGYRTLIATNGEEAVAVYTQHRDDISAVLTDMVMPIMDGRATICALRKINPAIKIVAVSGSESSGSLAQMSDAGIRHVLAKPYTGETLLKTLRMVLDEEAVCQSPALEGRELPVAT